MADEINVSGSLSVYKASVMSQAQGRTAPAGTFTLTGTITVDGTILVLTTETAIQTAVNNPHWAYFCNKDATNFVSIRGGTGGSNFIKLLPGEWAIVPLNPSLAYFAIADTASCYLEYFVAAL